MCMFSYSAKISTKGENDLNFEHAESIRRNLTSLIRHSHYSDEDIPLTNSATQTTRVRRSAGTQTDTTLSHARD